MPASLNYETVSLTATEDLLSNATLTTSGSIALSKEYGDCNLMVVTVSIGNATGTLPTLQFTLWDMDQAGSIYNPGTSSTFTSGVVPGTFKQYTQSNRHQLNWTITGSSPSFTGVNVTVTGFNNPAVRITNGTVEVAVKAASTAAAASDPSLVTAFSPNSPLPSGTNTIGAAKVTDGTNTAAVKAASTSPAATDPALVITESPNLATNLAGSGTITALNGTVEANTNGRSATIFRVTGTWVATIAIEGSVDGTNFVSVIGADEAQGISSSFSANQRVYVNSAGFQKIRLKATAFTSGTVVIDWDASVGSAPIFQVWNTNATSLKCQARLQDSLANNITSQAQGAQRPLDIDIVQGGNTAVVKAASTAAAAADPALVVSLSPNSPAPAIADVTATGALGALNAAVTVTIPGLNTVGMQLAAGTLIGTITPQYSYDGGTTWNPTYFTDPGVGTLNSTIVFGSSNTATSRMIIVPGGAGEVRVAVTAYTSGTANITLRASSVESIISLSGGTPGLPIPPVITQVGGSDGTNLRAVLTDTSGRVIVNQGIAGTLANGAETAVAGSAVQVLASNSSRKTAIIQNTGLANVRIGISGVTATTGMRIAPGDMILFDMPFCPTGAIFAIREGSISSIVLAQEIT